ncbi:MAG: ribosome-associated translation inhibitor RaiA [Actinomycetia bacterium]|nr:ribosome-associated translation inhibitor RaiA [Actinomycetes bacterium]
MDIVVTGRQTSVADRFRTHVEEKVAKAASLAPKTQRIEVMVSHEPNRRQAKAAERVEITCYAKGPVIRAEACADDKYAALDLAMDKLLERLRRRGDRRKVSRGRRTPESVAAATARFDAAHLEADLSRSNEEPPTDDTADEPFADSPIEVREKTHSSAPMSLEQALQEMELVGHDFYLFHDSETDRPSVVYRRRGWSYGVLHLDVTDDHAADDSDAAQDAAAGVETNDDAASGAGRPEHEKAGAAAS